MVSAKRLVMLEHMGFQSGVVGLLAVAFVAL